MSAAPPRAMPPLRQQNLRKLVRKLGASSQPGEQAQALAVIREGIREDEDFHFEAAIVAVGAIPLLVQLLGPGSPAGVQEDATAILMVFAASTDANKVAIVAAGAIPLLVQLMGPASPVMVQVYATNAIMYLVEIAEHLASISAAGAIPLLVQFLDPGDGPPAFMQEMAADTLGTLAFNAEDAVTIVGFGAVPLLVHLLGPGSLSGVHGSAARAVGILAENSENAVTIAASGAIPLLAQLLRNDDTKNIAAKALQAIRRGFAVNRAAVAAAKASAAMVQEMEALGVASPSDARTS
jgi:hypothetical protein